MTGVDTRLFRQLAAAYPDLSKRTTVYISPRDRAVRVSASGNELTELDRSRASGE